mmetsp:Transcript_94290/g.149075  ORF Transcript_94290/g.149075 Transcript_94290/m.149075 type:complete len:175 (+) Transcript_94290:69-593(+)|eukprot:CAMPEP_0169106090 /NCGR_PEP_ID=MMETSP1015-20121227/24147_1 /TAXON_ID=342587 /ORGANISM="Karlodinium micrum, Strain CCMP2283" /LENGTH=174 /DNA_ID=CAMNT_0009167499 /DNA_START=63 /DNA_END=590 /DNA_ORIENTATION=+
MATAQSISRAILPAFLPEGAWHRLVSQLDFPSCAALNSACGDTRIGTAHAMASLSQARATAAAQMTQAMATIQTEAEALLIDARRENTAAMAALQALAPMRENRLGRDDRFRPQLEQIFTMLNEQAGGNRTEEITELRQQRELEAQGMFSASVAQARDTVANCDVPPVAAEVPE